jgi:hypothetical protein
MPRQPNWANFLNAQALTKSGLTIQMLTAGVASAYATLDAIDERLLAMGNPRLSVLVELANLSSMLGNLLGSGIANASGGVFHKNRPHKYPDLLAESSNASDIEIKIALEDNKPQGHLPKSGFYSTCRYVLANEHGVFTRGVENRGDVVWIWELRAGRLESTHFQTSNTPGDSGKTAVVNAAGMDELKVVYCDLERFPGSRFGKAFRAYQALLCQ